MIFTLKKIKRLKNAEHSFRFSKPYSSRHNVFLPVKKKLHDELSKIILNRNFSDKTEKNKLLLKKLKRIDLADKLLNDLNLEFSNLGNATHTRHLKHLLNSI